VIDSCLACLTYTLLNIPQGQTLQAFHVLDTGVFSFAAARVVCRAGLRALAQALQQRQLVRNLQQVLTARSAHHQV